MGYSPERPVLKRMLPPNNMAIRQLAQEEGISAATLHKWRAQARGKDQLLPDADAGPEGWSSRDKFAAVLETAALNEADMAEYCRKRGLFRRSRPGVWPARQANDTVRARNRRPRKRSWSRIWNASLRAKTEHWRKLQRCLFCEKRHQRSGGTERTHDQHPRSPNRHCPDQSRLLPLVRAEPRPAPRWKSVTAPCGAGRKAVRFGLISVLSCHARNRPTSSARPNALPCWRPVIQRNFPACHQVRSCLTWPIKGYIWPRNRVSTAFCGQMGSSITEAVPSLRCGANHPPAIRPALPVRFGLGT